jgi:hypothetical protein
MKECVKLDLNNAPGLGIRPYALEWSCCLTAGSRRVREREGEERQPYVEPQATLQGPGCASRAGGAETPGGKSAQRLLALGTAISASHEIHPTSEAAVQAAVRKRVADRAELVQRGRRPDHLPQRRPLEKTPLVRSIEGGVDDTKFLYPVLDNIPLIVFPLLSHALAGVKVSLYGPPEVIRVAEVVRDRLVADELIEEPEQIATVEEDRDEISLSQSLRRSAQGLGAAPGEMVLWSAGDLVLAYDVYPWLMDRHIPSHELILDLNARQVVFPPGVPELFARSWFDSLRLDGEPGNAVDVKEPNLLLFTAAGLRGLGQLNELRQPRPGDTYVSVLLRAARRSLWHSSPAATLAFMRYGLKRTRGTLETADGLPQHLATELAGTFFGVPTMVKADNTDPFVVRDCDSFEDLFGYYRTVLQPIVDSAPAKADGYRELAKYHPHAGVLYRISLDLAPLWAEIPLWRRWPQLIQDRIATLNARLRAELKGSGFAGGGPPVPEYFDASGAFRGVAAPGDDIAGTRDFLRGAYRTRFHADRARYQQLKISMSPLP